MNPINSLPHNGTHHQKRESFVAAVTAAQTGKTRMEILFCVWKQIF